MLGGCGASSGSPQKPARPRVVNTEVTLTAPAGHYVAQCWFREGGQRPPRGRVVAVVVPDELVLGRHTSRQCVLSSRSSPWSHVLGITVGPDETLAQFRTRYVEPYEAEGGDDAVADVTGDEEATIFDGRVGQTLAFDSFSDGEQRHQVLAQFEDVRLTWSVPSDGFPDAAYDDSEQRAGIAGVQIVEDAPRPVAN